MFVSQAHSFRQQARLSITLAWVAGYTDILTLLACGTVTSHVSGTTANLGADLSRGQWRLVAYTSFLLTMFFLGAAISGYCTELGRRRGWESIYVLPIIVEAFLLGAFAVILEWSGAMLDHPTSAIYWMTGLASAAMGLQNATITRISSGTVRTTHVTGVLTDLGHEFVQFIWWLFDKHTDVPPGSVSGLLHGTYIHPTARRLVLLASIFFTFALGAGLGTFAYGHATRWAMFPPVAFLLWIIYQDITRPIAEIGPSELVGPRNGFQLPSGLAVFHLHKDHDRHGRVHRMPNLLAWSERLPATTRVVILDLGEVTQLDTNADMELHAMLTRLASQGRKMVIAGVTPDHFQRITHAPLGNALKPENICSDLELAIARGFNLLRDAGESK